MTLCPKNEELNDRGIEKQMADVFRCSTEISVAELDDSDDCENNLRADVTLRYLNFSVHIRTVRNNCRTDEYFVILSSKTYVFEDKRTKYQSV